MFYAKCYSIILREPLLSMSAKAMYVILKTFARKDGKAWPSKPTLAKHAGCNIRTVDRCINELAYFYVLTWHKGNSGRTNTYYLTDEKAAAMISRGEGPVCRYDPLLKCRSSSNHSVQADEEPPQKGQQGL